MPISRTEIQCWRDAILKDEWTAKYKLDQLAKHDHALFVEVAHHLVRDASPVVQRIGLQKLWERGDPDDAASQASALAFGPDAELQSVALEVLHSVRSLATLPTLLTLAERGSPEALSLVFDLVQTTEQKEHVFRLAQQYALSEDEDLRRVAAGILSTQLSLPQWEDLELAVARRYIDEDAIEALGRRATSRVVPVLQSLLEDIGPEYVESQAIESAIRAIAARSSHASDHPS